MIKTVNYQCGSRSLQSGSIQLQLQTVNSVYRSIHQFCSLSYIYKEMYLVTKLNQKIKIVQTTSKCLCFIIFSGTNVDQRCFIDYPQCGWICLLAFSGLFSKSSESSVQIMDIILVFRVLICSIYLQFVDFHCLLLMSY